MKLVAVAALGGILLAGAQEPKQQDVPVLRVDTRLVNLAVNVTDEHGALVGGLERDQFQVLEDGKPQKVAIFERESSTPLSMVMEVDASESVFRDSRLIRDAARRFTKVLLRPEDEMELMEFADSVTELVPFTADPRRIDDGLGRLVRGDATALYDAIYLGAQRLNDAKKDATRRRVIVLITDGVDTVKGANYTQALEQVQRSGAMVYCLIIVPIAADAGRNVAGEHALIQLSNDSGGKYFYVEDPKDLTKAMEKVSDDLRTQYLIGYYAPKVKPGRAGYRQVKVEMVDPALAAKLQVRHRTGYYSDGK